MFLIILLIYIILYLFYYFRPFIFARRFVIYLEINTWKKVIKLCNS